MNNDDDKKIAEYQATQDCYLHYDSFRWQSGSLIVAGVFVFWGFIFQSTIPDNGVFLASINLVITLLMSIWVLFAYHYRQIYLCKLHRLKELEENLGFEQHRRFDKSTELKKKYTLLGIKGHYLDLLLYYITSIPGVLFLIYKDYKCFQIILLSSPIFILIIVTMWVLCNEKRLKENLNKLKIAKNA